MLPVWVVLLPDMIGIYSQWEMLQGFIQKEGVESIHKMDNEVVARKFLREQNSVERLFLMGIDDTGKMDKNILYTLPRECRGKFKEGGMQENAGEM